MRRELKGLAERAFEVAPRPLSTWMYSAGRSLLFKDSRFSTFDRAFAGVARDRVPGDYLEFGCYRGASLTMAWRRARRYGLGQMRFFAFDSFEGLPASEGSLYQQGAYRCSLSDFERYVHKAGVDLRRLVAVQGMFDDTLTDAVKARHELRQAAVVHIDCNLYASARAVFSFIMTLIDDGTRIIVDDWYRTGAGVALESVGVRRAFLEWPGRHVCVDADTGQPASDLESGERPAGAGWGDNKMFIVRTRRPESAVARGDRGKTRHG